jgi:hypothetical protein
LAQAELDELKKQITYLLEHGLIQPSISPWGAPVFFRPKKDGTFKLCIDYRDLNKSTIKNRYTLPRIEDLINRVHSAKVFTKLDLWHGYHQVKINPADIQKTVFRTRYGHYEFKVLSFGLTNAPATFQNIMNDIFADLLDVFVLVYLDDILIFSANMEDHLKHVRIVLDRLRELKFYAKPSKCEFGKTKIEYVGFLVGGGQAKPHPYKVKEIKEWQVPQTPTQVRSFLGLCNYYRHFVPNYAQHAAKLTKLIKGNKMGTWTPECQAAFDHLKTALISEPVLHIANPDLDFTIDTDASNTHVGALFNQKDPETGHDYLVASFSKVLSEAEQKYPIREQELLAIRLALEQWRPYILFSQIMSLSNTLRQCQDLYPSE